MYHYEIKRRMQETHQITKTQHQNIKNKSKERYDKSIKPLNIKNGDKVLVQEKASKGKLAPKWHGPYPVLEISSESPNVTTLKRNKPIKLHKNRLRLFHE